jgi:hypothetical protein
LQLNTQIGQLNKALLADLISFQLFMSHQTPCLLPELRTRAEERAEEVAEGNIKRDFTLKKATQALTACSELLDALDELLDDARAHIKCLVFVLGATPRSPKCIWQLNPCWAATSQPRADDSRRMMRQLIPHSTMANMGPSKLFALVCTTETIDSDNWLTRVNFAVPTKRAKQWIAWHVIEHDAGQNDDVTMNDTDTEPLWYQWRGHVKGFKSTADWL